MPLLEYVSKFTCGSMCKADFNITDNKTAFYLYPVKKRATGEKFLGFIKITPYGFYLLQGSGLSISRNKLPTALAEQRDTDVQNGVIVNHVLTTTKYFSNLSPCLGYFTGANITSPTQLKILTPLEIQELQDLLCD